MTSGSDCNMRAGPKERRRWSRRILPERRQPHRLRIGESLKPTHSPLEKASAAQDAKVARRFFRGLQVRDLSTVQGQFGQSRRTALSTAFFDRSLQDRKKTSPLFSL